jgi:predicted nucleic acid-binding Zn ribbon protein
MPSAFLPEKSERAAVAARGEGVVASSRPCPVCGEAMTGRKTSACSDKCRAALSRRRRAEAHTERDRRVRELLEAGLRILGGEQRRYSCLGGEDDGE